MNTFGAVRKATKVFLEAGFMDGKNLFPTTEGTPQGSIVSPLLANIALYGFQTFIRESFPAYNKGTQGWKPHVIIYADDFVILHRDLKVIERSRELASEWLSKAKAGLELKASKTRISHTLNYHQENCGFNFLGFQVRQFPAGKTHSGKLHPRGQTPILLGFKTIISPGKEAQKRHLQAIKDVISTLKSAPQKVLIAQLNPNKGIKWIVRKYWRLERGTWDFALREGMRLKRHDEVPIRRHIKVRSTKSPFDGDWRYWKSRGRRQSA